MWKKTALILFVLLILLIVGGAWQAGSSLTAPVNQTVGNCPLDLACENVEFPSESGTTIKGWFLRGEPGKGTVVLMHGLRSNRLAMLDRIKFLRSKGYGVLAFDFQGSGESEGRILTFGFRESLDAEAAVRFARERRPDAKIGVIGISMGGAAFLLSKNMPQVDALVLEMVYPTMQGAIDNRLNMWLFSGAKALSPLLTIQFRPRLGVTVDDLRPIDHLPGRKFPLLLIAGENDRMTTIEESKQLFEAANEPKEMWIVPGADHQDLWKFSGREYQNRVLKFFSDKINDRSAPGGINEDTNSSCNCLDDDLNRKSGGNIDPGPNKD